VRIDASAASNATKQVARSLGRFVRSAVRNAGMQMKAQAKGTTRFEDHTGALRKSIGFVMAGDYAGQFKATAPHALFVEAGTKPHPIVPVRASRLRFMVRGQWVTARRVEHPGTHARDFMRDASTQVPVRDIVEFAVEEALKGGAGGN